MNVGQDIKAEEYTHGDYRLAGVAHVLNTDQEYEFYYRGKLITKEKADDLVRDYKKGKCK